MILLGSTLFTVSRPTGEVDAHGWVTDDVVPVGTVRGSLQQMTPTVDVAASGSGDGPNRPMVELVATAYVDGPVKEGDRLDVTHSVFVDEPPYLVRRVRPAPDPTGCGLDCWAADLSRVEGR